MGRQMKDDTGWLNCEIVEVRYRVLKNLNIKWLIEFVWSVKGFLQRNFQKIK